MNLNQKKAVVTGGDGGYGYGIAKVLKRAGCEVWITGRNPEKVEKAAEELGVHGLVADASKAKDWDRVMAETEGFDVLINNAGFGGDLVPVADQSDENIERVIATNLTGVILGCTRAARHMIKQKSGSIINISSVCAYYAWPTWSVYTAAKAGLSKFSKGLYTELRPYGIRVMCLTPSWGNTDFCKTAHFSGASEDPDLAPKCTTPEQLGQVVLNMLQTPDHLAMVDVTVIPTVQEISPM